MARSRRRASSRFAPRRPRRSGNSRPLASRRGKRLRPPRHGRPPMIRRRATAAAGKAAGALPLGTKRRPTRRRIMKATATILAAGLTGAFALAALDVPAEARERSGAREVRPAKRTAVNRRVAQRPIFRNEAAAYAPAVGYYAGPPPAQKPNGGPGRAQFEPLTIGAAPERGENRSPEGP